jgi:hypothetical protein
MPMGSLTTTAHGGLIQIKPRQPRVRVCFAWGELGGTLRLEADQNIVAWTSQIDNLMQDSSLVVGKSLQAAKLLIPSTPVSAASNPTWSSPTWTLLLNRRTQIQGRRGNLQASSVEVIPGKGLLSSADILSKLGNDWKLWPARNRVGER